MTQHLAGVTIRDHRTALAQSLNSQNSSLPPPMRLTGFTRPERLPISFGVPTVHLSVDEEA
jgi:hypothetical protein